MNNPAVDRSIHRFAKVAMTQSMSQYVVIPRNGGFDAEIKCGAGCGASQEG